MSTKKTRLEIIFAKYYFGFAILSALFFGSFNFILDSVVQQQMSLRVMYLMGTGCLVYFFVFHLYSAIDLKQTKGKFWLKSESAYYRDDGRIDFFLVKIILCRSVFSVMLFTLLYVIMYTSELSGISSSVIITLYAANILSTSVGFYFVYNEKLNYRHLIGMIFIIISIAFISQGKTNVIGGRKSDSNNTVGSNKSLSIFVPICLALLACLVITAQSLITRAIRFTKISSAQYTADSQFLSNSLLVCFGIYEQIYGKSYTSNEALIFISTSFLQIIGLLFLNGAIIFGKAGPSQALIQLQSPFQLALEIIIMSQIPNIYALSGMAICIVGALIIILGKK
ncbi:UNKNOWN [Stylonychia lemnae]|uniref:EamA domain-containing protein n=1 Tax=Stylonychia lemnae TaxID=5949 RepID=A0A078A1D0_STYLE|nr:UNKNOWN [Stylonychia lemnae]|eukprot:CDW75900.1 UNKNOWN [Stylonychia lemnae]